MKLTTKLFLLFTGFITFWVAIIYFIMPSYLLKEFYKLEDARINWEIHRTQELLEDLIHQSEAVLLDWSKWDDAYEFVMNPNISFIETNIPNSFYEDQGLNIVLIYDQYLNLTFSRGYNYGSGYDFFLSDEVTKNIKNYPNTSGLFYYGNKIYAFSSKTITDTKGTVEPTGLFVFMFELTIEHIDELSVQTGNTIVINDKNHINQSEELSYTNESDDYTRGYIFYPYINLEEGLLLSFDMPHSISELGINNTYKVIFIFIFFFVVFSIITYFWLRRTVKKLEIIISDVDYITRHKDLNRRITVKVFSEMKILKDGINHMLDEMSQTHEKLTNFASKDPLTGLLNRRTGFLKLSHHMQESAQNDFPLTIAFIDINNLKKINDVYGHNIGDEYITNTAQIIEHNTRKSDIFCRVGGDEFLLIFPLCSEKHAMETMNRIENELKEYNKTNDYPMSISYGIVEYDYTMDLVHYIEKADLKMYEHKKLVKSKLNKEPSS
ncbi:MAG: diguanylate cyclase [Clostridia bacterium]|nr:diguanylate cyclase [Clostridia bacterium]